MKEIQAYIKQNEARFLHELFELIRIPSISSASEHKADMIRCAECWQKNLLAAGADKAEVMPTDGNPVVYGEKIIDKKLPVVLVYGHYDVMPVDPIEEWKSQPFEPEIRDGKIYARGADDDKGQSFIHAKAFEFLTKTNSLPCNVKFMIEGEEEIGSQSLAKWCANNKKLLQADVILLSDTSMIDRDVPSITCGLRGLAYLEVEVKSANRDLHSGLYGGAVANPINILAKMIASLTDAKGRVKIKGFYKDVIMLSDDERKELNKAPFNLKEYMKALDIAGICGEEGYTTIERTGIRPSLDVCGIWGGYTGEGAKTVIPSVAYAKISMRLVPNQNHLKIAQLFQRHFESIAPECVKVKVTNLHGGQGYVAPTDSPAYMAASKALQDVYGKKPIPVRSGGSIPIISTFEEILGIKSIMMGFGLSSDAIHSPNENFPVYNFHKGIEAVALFYRRFADLMKK
ncbi:MAG: dipeptidase [Prevotellaceae bacterium]|jgi:acetylornithine deacetylase/succinyl-diaminopimelate desuccinylase-like protein|nr:dipeptidase [Prevotellaceae bacterium]